MKGEERRSYVYVNTKGKVQEVFCTRPQYLFLKFHYDIHGLTADEYSEYKGYFSMAE